MNLELRCEVCRFPIAGEGTGGMYARYSEINDYDARVRWHAEHTACTTEGGFLVPLYGPLTHSQMSHRPIAYGLPQFEWYHRSNWHAKADDMLRRAGG